MSATADMAGRLASDISTAEAEYRRMKQREAWRRRILPCLGIALGIAATTTVFGVAYGVLFRPLPFTEPERIVLIDGWNEQFAGRPVRSVASGLRPSRGSRRR